MGELWRTAITDSLNKFSGKVSTFLPNLLAMVTIFVIGFFLAWLLRWLFLRFLKAIQFDRASERWGLTQALAKAGVVYSPSQIFSRFVSWIIILITLLLGIDALEVAATRSLVAHFFNYLPHLFAALFILVIGYLIALFLGQAALIAAVNAQIVSARLVSQSVRWFVTILALTMALSHLGIAEKVIVTAFSITLGGIVLAVAIAFGWAGRDLAKDFLEKLYRRDKEKPEGTDRISHI